MTEEQRAARTAELWDLRHSDPVALMSAYRRAAGLNVYAPLPHGVAFPDMVAAIVDKESVATVTLDCPNCEHKGPKELILRRVWAPGTDAPQAETLYFVCPHCKAEYPVPTPKPTQ